MTESVNGSKQFIDCFIKMVLEVQRIIKGITVFVDTFAENDEAAIR